MTDIIRGTSLLYRVGKPGNKDGLWYDRDGNYTGLIHNVKDAIAADLPMGYDPIFRSDEQAWISCTETRDQLTKWFSASNMRGLLQQGYRVFEIGVTGYRRFFFNGFAHEVYSEREKVFQREIEPSLVFGSLV